MVGKEKRSVGGGVIRGRAGWVSFFNFVSRTAMLGKLLVKNKNGQLLPGARQFRYNQFSTSADFLFLLFSKQSRCNQFSK
jgi:hypothetical protein